MDATGQVVNLKKTKTFGPQGGATIQYKDAPVPKSEAVKILGVTWRFKNGSLDLQVDNKKVQEAVALANRIRYAGLPFQVRVMLNSSLVMSKILYGIEILDLPPGDERKLRTAIGFSIWQKSTKQRSPGLLFTLACKGHTVDPAQAPHVRRLTAMKRCLSKDGQSRQRVRRVLEGAGKRRMRTGGFVENLQCSVKRLNAHLDLQEDLIVLDIDGQNLEMTTTESSTWAHYAREAARKTVWKSIDHERTRQERESWGLAVGIDTSKTMDVYRKSRAQTQGVLRKIFLNAVWTQARRAKMPGNNPDPTCPCGAEKEDLRHLWWRCTRWDDIRRKHGCHDLFYDFFSIALRDLGLKLSTDDDVNEDTLRRIQLIMHDIFVRRFAGL